MELLKLDERPAEFQWKGISILYRKTVSTGDKFAIDTAGAHLEGDKIQFTPWEFYKTMIRIFVVGWKGVTDGGKEVPYSYETFLSRLPADLSQDLILQLGRAIAEETGFLTKDNAPAEPAIKNG